MVASSELAVAAKLIIDFEQQYFTDDFMNIVLVGNYETERLASYKKFLFSLREGNVRKKLIIIYNRPS